MNLEEIKSWIKDLDSEIVKEVIYSNGWSSYEEFAQLFIFKAFDDSYQKVEYGSTVYGAWSNDIQEISFDQVKLEIKEMEEIISDYSL